MMNSWAPCLASGCTQPHTPIKVDPWGQDRMLTKLAEVGSAQGTGTAAVNSVVCWKIGLCFLCIFAL